MGCKKTVTIGEYPDGYWAECGKPKLCEFCSSIELEKMQDKKDQYIPDVKEMIEIKNCPFCGNQPKIEKWEEMWRDEHLIKRIECKQCQVFMYQQIIF